MINEPPSKTWVVIIVAIIGAAGVIIAAIISLGMPFAERIADRYYPPFTPTANPSAPTPTSIPQTIVQPTVVSNHPTPPIQTQIPSPTQETIAIEDEYTLVPFESSGVLNSSFKWAQGGISTSTYSLEPQTNCIYIVGGPNSDHWGNQTTTPFLLYQVDGDFEATVEVFANPSRNYQMAGMGVLSKDQTVWFRAARFYYDDQYIGSAVSEASISQALNGPAYNLEHFYLKIEKQNNQFSSAYSSDGNVWTYINKNYSLNIASTHDIYLYALSAQNSYSFEAKFCDFRILKKS